MIEKKNIIANFSFVIILITMIGLIVHLFRKDDGKLFCLKKYDAQKTFLNSVDISIKDRLKKNVNQIKIFKNILEKSFASKSISIPLIVRDCKNIKQICVEIKNLLKEMLDKQYSNDFLAQINAADEIRELIFLKTTKLEILLKDTQVNKSKIRTQLLELEENLYKMELHLNALSIQI